MTDDLAAFIAARLDERARSAEGAGIIAWLTYRDADGLLYTTVGAITVEAAGGDLAAAPWCADGKLLARPSSVSVIYDEREVRREVAALRAIVRWHPSEPMRYIESSRCPPCELTWPCPTIRAIAAIWSDHADYRAEWQVTPSR